MMSSSAKIDPSDSEGSWLMVPGTVSSECTRCICSSNKVLLRILKSFSIVSIRDVSEAESNEDVVDMDDSVYRALLQECSAPISWGGM